MNTKVTPIVNQGDGGNQGQQEQNFDMKDAHRLDLPMDELQNGPVANRSCTDLVFCCLLLAFFVGMCGIAGFGYMNGDPLLLLTTWDQDGNGCGYNTSTKSYPYLYWPGPDLSNLTGTVNLTSFDPLSVFKYSTCVSSCPNNVTNMTGLCYETSVFNTSVKFKNCTYYPTAYYSNSLQKTYYGTPFRYSTKLVLNRYCVPDPAYIDSTILPIIQNFTNNFNSKFNVDKLTAYITDIYNVWYVEAISVGVAFGFGFIFMLVIRCCAGFIVWTSIFAIEAIIGGGGYWVYVTKNNYATTDDNYKYLTYGAYALWALAGLFFLIILCLCSRIRLGIAVAKVTGQFVYSNPCVLFVPIIFLVFCTAWVVAWGFTAVYLFSVGDIEPRPAPFSFVTTVVWGKEVRYFFLYHLFGALWINAFIIGCSQFIIAGACAVWYFSVGSDTAGKSSLCQAFKWILRYHIGSIAFGALIIAIVQFIRIIFEYYRKKIQMANKNNPIVKCMLCYTSYCLACLERCIKFITKNGYIQVALTSKNFCRSAWNAFILVVKNWVRFGASHTIGCIFMFLGRIFIVGATVAICYVMLTFWKAPAAVISAPYFPCIIAGLIAYLVGALFMSVYSFASDTIMQCFLLDEEMAENGKPAAHRPGIMDEFVAKANGKGCCC